MMLSRLCKQIKWIPAWGDRAHDFHDSAIRNRIGVFPVSAVWGVPIPIFYLQRMWRSR